MSPAKDKGPPGGPGSAVSEGVQVDWSPEVGWPKIIALTALLSFFIEVLPPLIRATLGDAEGSPFVPWTFHTLWEIGALLGVIWVVRQMKVHVFNFAAALLIGIFVSSIVWSFVPQSWILLEPNYYAVQSRGTLETHPSGMYDDYDWPLQLSYLYPADSPLLRAEQRRRAVENEYVATVGFLTWQSGLASGYLPHPSVAEYARSSTAQLYLTVGPVVLAESLIVGFYKNVLLFLVLQFIWFRYRHEFIWWP
jgi:hypothetical protein